MQKPNTLPSEFCDTCRATVDVYRKKGFLICENCDRKLFDAQGREIVQSKAAQ